MRSVVITGVSSGIGYAAAKLLADNGVKVFGSVRNSDDAERLMKDLGSNFVPLIFDVTEEDKVREGARIVREQLQGQTLWGLINNAGISVPGALTLMPVKDFRRQLDVNLIGQLHVIQAFTPLLGMDKSLNGEPGKIINISSVAGKRGFPFIGAYSTSKHALEGLSESLRRELMLFGIDVIIVGPGAIKTKIWDKARAVSLPPELTGSVYARPAELFREYMLTDADKNALPAEEVAALLLNILQSRRPKVRYAIVPGKLMNWTIPNLLPKRVVDWMIAKRFGLLKK